MDANSTGLLNTNDYKKNMQPESGTLDFWLEVSLKFYNKILKHPHLRDYFVHLSQDRVYSMVVDIWRIGLGEGGEMTARGLASVHQPLNITQDSFHKFVDCYVSVLRESGANESDIQIINENLCRHHIRVVHDQ